MRENIKKLLKESRTMKEKKEKVLKEMLMI